MKALLVLFFLFSSCTNKHTTIHGRVFCMPFTLKVYGRVDEDKLKQEIQTIFNKINQEVNHFNPDSIISKFNTAGVNENISNTVLINTLLQEAKKLYLSSQKRFDPTYTNFDKVIFNKDTFYKIQENLKIDLNALSKGKALDLISERLKQLKINEFIINWAGEICLSSSKTTKHIQIKGCNHKIKVKRGTLATSGAKEQAKGELTHFINTKTSKNIKLKDVEYESITVVSESCSLSDGLATCAYLFDNQNDLYKWIRSVKTNNKCRFYLLKKDKSLVVK